MIYIFPSVQARVSDVRANAAPEVKHDNDCHLGDNGDASYNPDDDSLSPVYLDSDDDSDSYADLLPAVNCTEMEDWTEDDDNRVDAELQRLLKILYPDKPDPFVLCYFDKDSIEFITSLTPTIDTLPLVTCAQLDLLQILEKARVSLNTQGKIIGWVCHYSLVKKGKTTVGTSGLDSISKIGLLSWQPCL